MIVIEENDDFLSCYMEIMPSLLSRLIDDGDVVKISHCNTAVSSLCAVLRPDGHMTGDISLRVGRIMSPDSTSDMIYRYGKGQVDDMILCLAEHSESVRELVWKNTRYLSHASLNTIIYD